MIKRNYFLPFVLIVIAIYGIFYKWTAVYENDGFNVKISDEDSIEANHIYILNNNLAQYSVYIIDQNNGEYLIEAFVALNFHFTKNYSQLEIFRCLLKLINIKKEEIIELKPVESAAYYWNDNRKLTFKFQPELFKSYYYDSTDFSLDNLVIAVIRVGDYDKNITIEKVNFTNITSAIALPYELIQYQKPSILTPKDPIEKNIGVCAHYLYSVPKQLLSWIDMHLSFNVGEILIYDSTENFTLSEIIRKKYGKDERVTVRKYNIEKEHLCRANREYPENIKSVLNKLCYEFFITEFKEKYHGRSQHEQLTSNDCFSVLSRKYEFITYYDSDEFVFPRFFDQQTDFYGLKKQYMCNSTKEICSTNSFKNMPSTNKINYFYNYIRSVVDKYSNGRNVSLLNSISFKHAAYIIPDKIEQKLISDLRNIIQIININQSSFPIKVRIGDSTTNAKYHFIINETDVDYLRYFYKSYEQFMSCIYNIHLKNIPNIDSSLVRHLYFLTHNDQRWPKAIHYYKNVKGLFIHFATHVTPGSWTLFPPSSHGHFLAHFRPDMYTFYEGKFEGSIRNLYIDFEYVFYLLQHYTKYCKN